MDVNTYLLYGVEISVDFKIPGLRPHKVQKLDLQVQRSNQIRRAHWDHVVNEGLQTLAKMADTPSQWVIEIPHVLRARIQKNGRELRYEVLNKNFVAAQSLVLSYLIPLWLSVRGQMVVHASSVDSDGEALVFIGRSGYGKSTLAAFLHQSGNGVIGDDATLLSFKSGQIKAVPSYPEVKLSEKFKSRLFPLAKSQAIGSKTKVFLPLKQSPKAVRALIFLKKPNPRQKRIRLQKVSGLESFPLFLEQLYRIPFSSAKNLEHELDLAVMTLNSIPCYTLAYPRKVTALRQVRRELRLALRELTVAKSP